MSKLIIVCGLSGSGKTSLAKELSKKMKIICFHKDSLKEKLFELLNGKSEEDSIKIGKLAIKLFFTLIEEQLSRNLDLIIEAPFNFMEDYKLLGKWEKSYELDLYSIICSIDNKTRKGRIQSRERHEAHWSRDKKINLEDEFDYKNIPGKQIRINTDEPIENLVDKIIMEIKN
jgi:predicted kinase